MIIIWGRTTRKSLHPNGEAMLGAAPAPCPMRNCRGICKLYLMTRYCHMYWIPCFPTGEPRPIIQCNSCRAMIDFEEYKQWRSNRDKATAAVELFKNLALGVKPNQSLEDAAKEWLNKGRFDKAEVVARAGLDSDPQNINLMCLLDAALNGLGKAKDSDKLVCQIVYHWETHCKQGWIASGRREELAAFPRVILKNGLPDYRIEGKQYFQPQHITGLGTAIYKVLVYPKEEEKKTTQVGAKIIAQTNMTRRLFKLLQIQSAGHKRFVLKEFTPTGKSSDAILYAEDEYQQPDIRKVTSDVMALLALSEKSHQSLPMVGVCGTREELADGNKDFDFFDAAGQDPRSSRLKDAVENCNWRTVRDFLAMLLPEERSFWMGVVSNEIEKTWSKTRIDGKMSVMLDSWKQAEPDSVDCRLIRLETYISWAWNARTAQLAAAVSESRFAEFHKRLMEAAVEFDEAKSLCRHDPILYSCGMTIVRGLGDRVAHIITMEQCVQGLQELSNDPLFYNAHLGALQKYCRKWGGSHQKMFDYARSITSQLPDGHPLWVLIPKAHFERVLIEKVDGYWQREDVRREILDAYQRAFPPGVATVVSKTAPHRLSQEWVCRNYFAYCMMMTQQYEEARQQIRAIGKRPIGGLWAGDYKYYAIMLGFDIETGPAAAACWEDPSSSNNNDNNNERIPLAQAKVSPQEMTSIMPVAEAKILPEVV